MLYFFTIFFLCFCNAALLRGNSVSQPSFDLLSNDNDTGLSNDTESFYLYEIDWIAISNWTALDGWNESTLLEVMGIDPSHVQSFQFSDTIKKVFTGSASNPNGSIPLADRIVNFLSELSVTMNITELGSMELTDWNKTLVVFIEDVIAFDPSGQEMNDTAQIASMLKTDLSGIAGVLNSLQNANNDTNREALFNQLDNLNFTLILAYWENLTDPDSFNLSPNGLLIGIEQNNIPVIGGVIRMGWKNSTNDDNDAFQAFVDRVEAASDDLKNATANAANGKNASAGLKGIIIGIPIAIGLFILAVICCFCCAAKEVCGIVC